MTELAGVRGLCDNIFVFNNMHKFVTKIKYILLFLFFKASLPCIAKKKKKLIRGFLTNFNGLFNIGARPNLNPVAFYIPSLLKIPFLNIYS